MMDAFGYVHPVTCRMRQNCRTIKYRRARIFFENNYFDKTIPLFKRSSPKTTSEERVCALLGEPAPWSASRHQDQARLKPGRATGGRDDGKSRSTSSPGMRRLTKDKEFEELAPEDQNSLAAHQD